MDRFTQLVVVSIATFLWACGDAGGGAATAALADLYVTTDFGSDGTQSKARMASQTPSAYQVSLCRVGLWNPTTDEHVDLFSHERPADCPVFDFTEGEVDPMSLVPDPSLLPDEPGFGVVEMDILYLQMDLDFLIEATGTVETRTLRIYFSSDGEYRHGDVAVVRNDASADNWGFGTGNMTGDPMLRGLPRAQAYTLEEWPRGDSTQESGPFGGGSFWTDHPPNPFTWAVALPPGVDEAALIVFRVPDTWHFTDQNEDGVYDWPGDYGNDWSMDFPTIVATEL